MKTNIKTLGISFSFFALMLTGNVQTAQAGYLDNEPADSSKTADPRPVSSGEQNGLKLDLDNPFYFSDTVEVHVYNQNDELIFNESFTREESENDAQLKTMLKNSEFLLQAGNHYYYMSK